MTIGIWALAILAYLAFRFWYDGFRKPLTPDEIEHFMHKIEKLDSKGEVTADIATIRKLMEKDDGKEVILVNLIEFNSSPMPDPDTGQDVTVAAVLTKYAKPIMRIIMRRGGHPVISMRGAGGYIDSWNTPPDPDWSMVSLIRYRSRRDLLLIMTDPVMEKIHKYKIAAIKQTFSTPTQLHSAFWASPRVSVALVLALSASLLQLALC